MDYTTLIRPIGSRVRKAKNRLTYIIDQGEHQTTINGQTVSFPVPNYQRFRFVASPNEQDTLADFLSEIREGDIVYDVGSHKGIYAAFAAEVGCDVYAFEPIESNQAAIEDVQDANSFSNLNIIEVALSNTNGDTELVAPTDDSTYREGKDGVTVPQRRGDSLDLPSPHGIESGC